MIIGIAIGMRILVKICKRVGAEGARQRDLGEIDAAEAGRRVDHHHRPAGQRHRDDARLAAEAEAQDQQRHQRQHRRGDEEQDVGRDHLLDEGELGDDRGEDEADRAADGEADEQLLERGQEMRPDERPLGDQRRHDLARRRQDVLRHLERR